MLFAYFPKGYALQIESYAHFPRIYALEPEIFALQGFMTDADKSTYGSRALFHNFFRDACVN